MSASPPDPYTAFLEAHPRIAYVRERPWIETLIRFALYLIPAPLMMLGVELGGPFFILLPAGFYTPLFGLWLCLQPGSEEERAKEARRDQLKPPSVEKAERLIARLDRRAARGKHLATLAHPQAAAIPPLSAAQIREAADQITAAAAAELNGDDHPRGSGSGAGAEVSVSAEDQSPVQSAAKPEIRNPKTSRPTPQAVFPAPDPRYH